MEYHAWALTIGAGLTAKIYKGLIFGLSINDLGLTTRMADSVKTLGNGEKLPFTSRLGGSWSDTIGKSLLYSVSLEARYDYVGDTSFELRKNFSKRLTVPAGLSITPVSFLTLRVGKRFGWQGELMDFGGALNVSPFTVDIGCALPRIDDATEFRFSAAITCSPERHPSLKRKHSKVEDKKAAQQESVQPVEEIISVPLDQKKTAPVDSAIKAVVKDTVLIKPDSVRPSVPVLLIDTLSKQTKPADTIKTAAMLATPVKPTAPDSSSAKPIESQKPSDAKTEPVSHDVKPVPVVQPSYTAKIISPVEDETVILK